MTAFLSAAENGELERVRAMVEARPDLLHSRDSDLYTALHRASYGNHKEVTSKSPIFDLVWSVSSFVGIQSRFVWKRERKAVSHHSREGEAREKERRREDARFHEFRLVSLRFCLPFALAFRVLRRRRSPLALIGF